MEHVNCDQSVGLSLHVGSFSFHLQNAVGETRIFGKTGN